MEWTARESVEFLWLELFKTQMDTALSNLV